MLSRVANSIYWMQRYIERAENVARFIEVNTYLLLDLAVGVRNQWEPLISITADNEAFIAKYGEYSQENVVRYLAFDAANPNSIVSCIRSARENARAIRFGITTEMWEQINKFYIMVNSAAAAHTGPDAPYDFLTNVKLSSHLFNGIMDATMSHGEAWHFSRLGGLLERADNTSRLLDVKYFILLPDLDHVGTAVDDIQWGALLRSASAFEMYRQQYGAILPDLVVEFLVLDRAFPRAILHGLNHAEESMREITGSRAGMYRNAAEQHLGRLRSELAYTSAKDIIAGGLHEFLDGFQTRLNGIGRDIHETYFALPAPPTQRQEQGPA